MSGRRYNLPHHRRRNWLMVWDNVKFSVIVIVIALAALCLIAIIEDLSDRNLAESDARREAEQAHAALVADVVRIAQIGAPGYTKTDWTEGTTEVILRKIK